MLKTVTEIRLSPPRRRPNEASPLAGGQTAATAGVNRARAMPHPIVAALSSGAALVAGGILMAELLAEPAAPETPEPIFEGRVYLNPGGVKSRRS